MLDDRATLRMQDRGNVEVPPFVKHMPEGVVRRAWGLAQGGWVGGVKLHR